MSGKGLVCSLLLCSLLAGCGSVAVDGTEVVETEERYVALTFDDGPRRETTERLLDGLRERGASATFFLVGEQIQKNQDLVQRMAAEGHQVGNHSWSHVQLEGLPLETAQEEIQRTDQQLQEVLGEGSYWLRPPYGRIGKDRSWVPVPLVIWSVDSRDWESRNADTASQAILEVVKPNDIILMHDIYESSVDAALRVVDALQAQGYVFVTVQELLALNGVKPEPGALYHNGKG